MRNGKLMNENNSSAAVKEEVKPATVAATTTPEDVEFENELNKLESSPKPGKPARSELEKATFAANSILKRVKDLGGDPAKLVSGEVPIVEKPAVDTSEFVTKADLAEQRASALAKSPGELKVIMWWVKNKGMSVEDAHFMANKGRITKLVGEVARSQGAIPSLGGGAGERPVDKTDAPELSEGEKTKLLQSGMKWVPEKKAWVGKKVQQRWNEATKQWVTERV